MFKVLFLDIKSGTLLRMPYVWYSLLLMGLLIAFIVATVLSIGIGEHLASGNLSGAQNQLLNAFSGPYLVTSLIFMCGYFFASYNILAKRIRDTGLPGWWAVLVILVVELVISALFSSTLSSLAHLLITAAVVFIPSDRFKQ